MAVEKHLGIVMLLVSCAAAQTGGTATVKSVTAERQGNDVRIEIILSAPVTPSVETATHPDRILLDFPGTTSADNTRRVEVSANGVRRVRTAQHSATPLVTRVVVDLDRAHAHTVASDGNRVVVIVGAVESARSGAPVAATTGNLIGIFRKQHEKSAPFPDNTADPGVPVPPAASSGPAFEPPKEETSVAAVPREQPKPAPQSAPAAPSPENSAGQARFDANQVAAAPGGVNAVPAQAGFPSGSAPNAGVPPSPPMPEPSSASPSTATATPGAEPVAPTPHAESTLIARVDDPSLRTVFKVKYVAEGVAYLEGGRAQGLAEGMKLEIEDTDLPAKQGGSAIGQRR